MRLPVHEIEGALVDALRSPVPSRVLLKAPTGSGKSTVVPGLVLDSGAIRGRVVVVEPRRMAARLLAGWVARQRGTNVGAGVGYAVRFDTKYGRDTGIVFVTDGVFQRWLQDAPGFDGVGAVVFDEFHERRLAGDVALARCLDLQDGPRPDLRVVVMSATLETAGLAEYLAPAVLLETGGRMYPVEMIHRPERAVADRRGGPPRETPVWERVAEVCREALAMPDAGHVLCFLPGLHEIRKTVELLENSSWARGREIHALASTLPPAAQEAAVSPSSVPRIIVATNVAETSITIEGVRTVVDAGLARVDSFDPRRGIDTLLVKKISRASAEQRAGRAGRTAPGRCFRLWSEAEHTRRESFETPEVRRVDLAETVLLLKAAGVGDVRRFRWLDAPAEASVARAEELLHDLGAIDHAGGLTEEGVAMARLPLAPRFARLMLAGVAEGCVAEAAFIAAAVQGEGIFSNKKGGVGRKDFLALGCDNDFAGEWSAFESASAMDFDARRCAPLGILGRGAREVAQGFERLRRISLQAGWPWEEVDFGRHREAIGRAMLAAFSDRLAVRFGAATLACRVVHGRRGKLDDESAARAAAAFVAAEITEVEGRDVIVHLRRAAAVDLDWLRGMFAGDFSEVDGVAYDETRRRVVARRETRFRDLVLDCRESDTGVNVDAAAALLAERVMTGDLVLKGWTPAVEQWTARLACLSAWMPELELPGWNEEDRRAVVEQLCHGALAYKDIKELEMWPVLRQWLSAPQHAALDAFAPERIELSNGQSAKVTYEAGREPVIALRVQQLFGVRETPAVASGRVPVVVQLLAPNQRPWQVTKDLRSFWSTGYAQMRKDLAGRYPKHRWPEDPHAPDAGKTPGKGK